jgi:hypothetical protein
MMRISYALSIWAMSTLAPDIAAGLRVNDGGAYVLGGAKVCPQVSGSLFGRARAALA